MPNPLQDRLNTLDEDQVAQLYKNVFDSEEAELVLEDLKNRCFAKVTSFNGDAIQTCFNEGMRSVLLHIENQINLEPLPEPINEMESE